MIAANMIPDLLRDNPSAIFRLYGSFAAPTFIFLSGMTVSFTVNKKRHTAVYFIKRTIMLLLTGAALDVLLSCIFPFTTFDVLYLIGVSILITFLFKKLKPSMQYILIIIIFVLTPLLQNIFGYQKMPIEIPLSMIGKNIPITAGTIFRQLLIDGWFPLFPWLGFSFLGSIAADIRFKIKSFSKIQVLFIGLLVLIIGEILWTCNPSQIFIRKGYSELFYPPTIGFILTAIGVITIIFYIVDLKNDLKIYTLFSTLGRWSLQIYVIHLVIIHLLGKAIPPQSINNFLLIYLGFVMLFYVAFSILEKLKIHKC